MDGWRVIFRHIVVPCAIMCVILGFAVFLLLDYPMVFVGLVLLVLLWGVITGIQAERNFRQKGYRAGHKGRDHIFYQERIGERTQELIVNGELLVDAPYLVYVPSDEEWKRQMPDWAQGRKAEIIQRIKEELGTTRYEFVEN